MKNKCNRRHQLLAGALSLNNLQSKLSIKALNEASIMFVETPIVNQFFPLASVLSIETLVIASVPVFKILTLQSTNFKSFRYFEYLANLSTLFLIALSSALTGPLPSPSQIIFSPSTSRCAFADEIIFPEEFFFYRNVIFFN